MQDAADEARVGEDRGGVPGGLFEDGDDAGLLQEENRLRRKPAARKLMSNVVTANSRRGGIVTRPEIGEPRSPPTPATKPERRACNQLVAVSNPADATRPYMKSAISEPSRITATAQTTPRATIERLPALTASPTCFTCAASWRPWLAIQTLCQISMTTAIDQDRGVENLLPDPGQRIGDHAGKGGDQRCADDACRNAGGDDEPAAVHALRHREHDADDQARLDDFAKDDDQRA